MTDDIVGCAETPLLELARSVPKDLRGEWESQWWEDGTPCGHSMAPVGKYLHDMADEIERLRTKENGQEVYVCELEARIEKLEAVVDAAKWFSIHCPKEHIGGMVQRSNYTKLLAALEEAPDQATT